MSQLEQRFPTKSRQQWLDNLERKAKSDAAIRKGIADYKNMQVGIASATSNLFNPITKATAESSEKQLESQKQLARKQFLATNSAAVDQALLQQQAIQISKDNVKKLKKLSAVMNTYVTELKKGRPSDKEEAILAELGENATRTQSILEHIEKQKAASDELNKTIDLEIEVDRLKSELSDAQKLIQRYKDTGGKEAAGLAEVQEAQQELLVEAVSRVPTSSEPSTSSTPYTVLKPSESVKAEKSSDKHLTEDYYKELRKASNGTSAEILRIIEEIKKTDPKYTFKYATGDEPEKILDDLDKVEKVYRVKASKEWKEHPNMQLYRETINEWEQYRKKRIGERFEDPYLRYDEYLKTGKGLDSKLNSAAVNDINRIQVLLASNNAGNDAGLQEFLKILKKLLRQKIMTKTDYNRFVESWRK